MKVPYGYCHCGCGRQTLIHEAKPRRYRHGHSRIKPIRYEVDPVTGCWNWKGRILPQGYGRLRRGGVETYAHRWFYEKFRAPIPAGLQIDHLCRNRACVNPDHLEPVTATENLWRGNAPWAVNARATHCKRGHLLAGDNLRLIPPKPGENRKSSRRVCKTCERIRNEAYRAGRPVSLAPVTERQTPIKEG